MISRASGTFFVKNRHHTDKPLTKVFASLFSKSDWGTGQRPASRRFWFFLRPRCQKERKRFAHTTSQQKERKRFAQYKKRTIQFLPYGFQQKRELPEGNSLDFYVEEILSVLFEQGAAKRTKNSESIISHLRVRQGLCP